MIRAIVPTIQTLVPIQTSSCSQLNFLAIAQFGKDNIRHRIQ
jgi:hypothetical protein